MPELNPMRVFFEKSGRAVYLSHLDLVRAMGRALSRSGLPVWYTMGFHPHVYTTFALPLSLGVTGLCESMDFRLTEDVPPEETAQALGRALPQGLKILFAAPPVMAPKAIFWADYRLDMIGDIPRIREAFLSLREPGELVAQKRGKKGVRSVDIKPLCELLDIPRQEQGISAVLRCRAGVDVNLNPSLALEALEEAFGFAAAPCRVTRTRILTRELDDFR